MQTVVQNTMQTWNVVLKKASKKKKKIYKRRLNLSYYKIFFNQCNKCILYLIGFV